MNITISQYWLFSVLSFLFLVLGQPALFPPLAPVTALLGLALFWLTSWEMPSWRKRLVYSCLFFTAVQAALLIWFLSHPFWYAPVVLLLLAITLGVPCGIVSTLVTPQRLSHLSWCFVIPACWTIAEWLHLFLLPGMAWNPIGLVLSSNDYARLFATLFGTYGLSFWVVLANCLVLRAFLLRSCRSIFCALFVASIPYLYGVAFLCMHTTQQNSYDQEHTPLHCLVVSTAFLPEEIDPAARSLNPIVHAWDTWQKIIALLHPALSDRPDMILLPEVLVSFSASTPLFPRAIVASYLENAFPNTPLPTTPELSHTDIAQFLANAFNCPFIVGLERTEWQLHKPMSHNSAFCFYPKSPEVVTYDKQLLIPMGEYIPWSWAKAIAAPYGITDSFIPGFAPSIAAFGSTRASFSICYEEINGDLMRLSRLKNSNLLLNLSNDGWYPNSLLALQHFAHARLRTVENGMALLRSCNFGFSCAVDAFGRVVAAAPLDHSSTLRASLSLYSYSTLYTRTGDALVIALCFAIIATALANSRLASFSTFSTTESTESTENTERENTREERGKRKNSP